MFGYTGTYTSHAYQKVAFYSLSIPTYWALCCSNKNMIIGRCCDVLPKAYIIPAAKSTDKYKDKVVPLINCRSETVPDANQFLITKVLEPRKQSLAASIHHTIFVLYCTDCLFVMYLSYTNSIIVDVKWTLILCECKLTNI